jgi:protein-S-isoprenylcysteine O-methyltransferase Ste14
MATQDEKRSSRGRWAAGLLSGLLLVAPAVALACEACKEAVKDDPVGTALSATTLLLIGMPALLIGSIGGWIGYVYWRASRQAAAVGVRPEQPSEVVSQPI